MDDISARRKKLFACAKFSSVLLSSGDAAGGVAANFAYFSGCGVDGAYLVLKRNRGALYTYEMNIRAAKKLSFYPAKVFGKKPFADIKKAAGSGRAGFSSLEMPAVRYLNLRKKARLKFVDATGKMYEIRGRKSPAEISKLAASAKIARKILEELDPWQCRTEEELACSLKIAALEEGAEISFEPIVATGANSAMPHHAPTGKKLGDFILVDFGVKKDGYCSDFTRCYFRRRGMKEQQSYSKCISVFEEIIEGLKGCKGGNDVAALSAALLERHGLPRLPHAIGHGIGLEVHEYPHLGKKSVDALVPGTVLAIEPAAYFSGYGVRFEDMVANIKGAWKKI